MTAIAETEGNRAAKKDCPKAWQYQYGSDAHVNVSRLCYWHWPTFRNVYPSLRQAGLHIIVIEIHIAANHAIVWIASLSPRTSGKKGLQAD